MGPPTFGDLWRGTAGVVARNSTDFAALALVLIFLPAQLLRLFYPEIAEAAGVGRLSDPDPLAGAMAADGYYKWRSFAALASLVAMLAIAAVAADPALETPARDGGRPWPAVVAAVASASGRLFGLASIFLGLWLVLALGFGLVITMLARGDGLPRLDVLLNSDAPVRVIFGTALAVGAGGVLLMLLFSALTIWTGLRLTPLTGVFLRERLGVLAGMRRAWRLSQGSTGPIFAMGIVAVGPALALSGPVVGPAGMAPEAGLGGFLGGLVLGLAWAALLVWQAAGLGFLYRRLRAAEALRAGADSL